ncbi:hypothetical protein ACFU9Y_33795, partial [Streptomyces sp. NPDC057621]
PTVFAGYLRRDGDHRSVSGDDAVVGGRLRTGDLGFVRDERIHLRGRQKDLIIRGGHNIDPAVIEDALLAHPAVAAAAAVGRPHRFSGEIPVAFVALAADTTVEELTAWARTHITEPAARPELITVLGAIPLTEIGKPFKPALRETAAARHFHDEFVAHGIDAIEIGVAHEAGRLVVRLTGKRRGEDELDKAAALLREYDVLVRTEEEGTRR